jgi:hypothetical protein
LSSFFVDISFKNGYYYIMELHREKPGKYYVKQGAAKTHEITRIKIRNDGSVKYANGFSPDYVDRWVFKPASGSYDKAQKFLSLNHLLEIEFPFGFTNKKKSNGKVSI